MPEASPGTRSLQPKRGVKAFMKKKTKLKRADFVIIAVLLAAVIAIPLIMMIKDKTSANSSSSETMTATDYIGKRIGIRTGSSFEEKTFKLFPDSEYSYYDTNSDLIIALQNNKIDAFLVDEPEARMIHNEQNDVNFLSEVLETDDYSFAFQKDTAQGDKLRGEFDAFLAKLKESGELDKMKTKWTGVDESAKTFDETPLSGENGTLKVAGSADNMPFVYVRDNRPVGYAVELITRFAREYGYGIDIELGTVMSSLSGMATNTYDILIGSMSVTEERKQSVSFSDTVYNGGAMLVVRSDDIAGGQSGKEITSAEQLNSPEYKVGYGVGTPAMNAVDTVFPDSEQVPFSDQITAYEAVRQGKVDAFVYQRELMDLAIKNGLPGVRLLDEDVGEPVDNAVGISRKASVPDLKEKLDAFIRKLKADGTIDEMYKRWVEERNYEMPDIPEPASPRQTLKVGTAGTVEPFTFYHNNTLSGFDIELAKRFALEIDAKIEFTVASYPGIIAAANTGEIDCIFADLNMTEETKEVIDFSEIVYTTRNTVMVADSSSGGSSGSWYESLKDSFKKNFIREDRYKLIIKGVGTSCMITLLSMLFGSVLAFLICIFRRTDSFLANKMTNLYVRLMQGTPLVVLLMILYYVVFSKSGISAVWVAVIGFSLSFAAYVSEVLRTGIESIDNGQREAALALGFSEKQAFFRFIFPQAAIRSLPVYRGEVISLLKNTSIVGYIAIQDLTKMSDIIRSRTYEAFFPLIVTAIVYFIIAWLITLILNIILKKTDPHSKKRAVKGVSAQ